MVQFVPEIVSYVLVRFFFFALSTMAGSLKFWPTRICIFVFDVTQNIQMIGTLFTWSKWNLILQFSDDEKLSRYFVFLFVIPLLETIFAYLFKGKIFAQKISIKRTTFFPQLGIFFLDTFHT